MENILNRPPLGESHKYLGYFETVEDLKKYVGDKQYEDDYYAVVAGKITPIYQVVPSKLEWMYTDMVSYRNSQGMLIDKDDYYILAAKADLARIGVIELQQNFGK